MSPKLKYDVSQVEDVGEYKQPKPGMYRAKVLEVNAKQSKNGNDMLEVILEVVRNKEFKGSRLWHYLIPDHDSEFVRGKFKEFIRAIGKRMKGTLDTDAIVGTEVQVQVKSDTDLDGNYRARVGKVLALAKDEDDEPDEDEDDEPDEDEPDDDESDEDEDEDGDDDEEEEEEDDEEDDEEEDDDDEAEDYAEWSIADLKNELKERGLKTAGKKSALVTRLEQDDNDDDEPF